MLRQSKKYIFLACVILLAVHRPGFCGGEDDILLNGCDYFDSGGNVSEETIGGFCVVRVIGEGSWVKYRFELPEIAGSYTSVKFRDYGRNDDWWGDGIDVYVWDNSSFTWQWQYIHENHSGSPNWADYSANLSQYLYYQAGKWVLSVRMQTTASDNFLIHDVHLDYRWEDPEIAFTPTSISETVCRGDSGSGQTFQVWNSGYGTLDYTISDDQPWLHISPTSGTSTGVSDKNTHTVTYTAGLSGGTYQGEITISDPAASNNPQTIPVTLTVVEAAIACDTTSLSPVVCRGSNASSQTFQVWNSGFCTLNYNIFKHDATWLSIGPTSGTSTGVSDKKTHTVTYNTSGLPGGTYAATIEISDHIASNSPQMINVTLTVQEPGIARSPTSLSQTVCRGDNASSEMFQVWNSGNCMLNYEITDDVDWLGCSPTSGTSSGEHDAITATYTTEILNEGTYQATITITDTMASNNPQAIPVTLTVYPPEQSISISLEELDFGSSEASMIFEVWNAGTGTLEYTVTDDANWVAVNPTSGSSTGPGDKQTHAAMVDRSGFAPGEQKTAAITVSSDGAANSPQEILLYASGPEVPDLNNDGIVNFLDFAICGAYWLDTCSEPNWCEGADFDRSGQVDCNDLCYLANNWLRGASRLLFFDDFENIAVGDYPDENGWLNMFSGVTAYVTDEQAYSSAKSFRLEGQSSWSRHDYVDVSPVPDKVIYEACIRLTDSAKGAGVGFLEKFANMGPKFNAVVFQSDNRVLFYGPDGDVLLESWNADKWYKVHAEIDFTNEVADVTIVDLESNDTFLWENLTAYPIEFTDPGYGFITLDNFGVCTENFDYSLGGTDVVYFDDVKFEEAGAI